MAKDRIAKDGVSVVPIEETGDEGALQTELERLRRENDILRGRLMAPTGLASAPGRERLYRVRLPRFRPVKCKLIVTPKLNASASILMLPEAEYDALDVFLHEAGGDPKKLSEGAWQRYVAAGNGIASKDEQGATASVRLVDAVRDRNSFRVQPQPGDYVDSLDLPAASAAEAFAKFCRFCGISTTTQRPAVEILPDDGNGAATPVEMPPVIVV